MSNPAEQGGAPGARDLIVLGTGGNCIDIAEMIHDINAARRYPAYQCAGFLDDDEARWGTEHAGVPVLGPLASARDHGGSMFVNGIGSPTNFRRKAEIIARTGLPESAFATLVHPTAYVSPSARIGAGSVVFPNVTINSNVRLDRHVLVLSNAVISHDVVVGDYTCITGGVCISGGVRIEDSCYLGTNSSIIGSVRLGKGCLVGMGSVALQDVGPGDVVAGNPARSIRRT